MVSRNFKWHNLAVTCIHKWLLLHLIKWLPDDVGGCPRKKPTTLLQLLDCWRRREKWQKWSKLFKQPKMYDKCTCLPVWRPYNHTHTHAHTHTHIIITNTHTQHTLACAKSYVLYVFHHRIFMWRWKAYSSEEKSWRGKNKSWKIHYWSLINF